MDGALPPANSLRVVLIGIGAGWGDQVPSTGSVRCAGGIVRAVDPCLGASSGARPDLGTEGPLPGIPTSRSSKRSPAEAAMADETATRDAEHGYWYQVSDEQRRVFASRTPEQRLRWLEDMREFTWATATEETRRWWKRLRAGGG